MDQALYHAKENLVEAQRRQAIMANTKRREYTFNVGDKVLLSAKYLNLPTDGPSRKLQAKYIGPFEVEHVISTVAYKLRLPDHMRIHPVFHVSLLKPYIDNPSKFTGRSKDERPPPTVMEDGHEEFEVEEILDKRRRGRGVQYLVKWKGYPDYEASWEPLRNLTNALEAIEEFEARYISAEDVAS